MGKINIPVREYDPADKVQRCELCHYFKLDEKPEGTTSGYCYRKIEYNDAVSLTSWCGDFVHLAEKSSGRYTAKRKSETHPSVTSATDLPHGEMPYTLWDEQDNLGEGWNKTSVRCELEICCGVSINVGVSSCYLRIGPSVKNCLPLDGIRNIGDLNRFVEVLTWAMGMKGDA